MNTVDTAKALADLLLTRNWKIALAESCTGGLVCATLTELPGSSAWFERGYITYSNLAKTECLGVPTELIESHENLSSLSISTCLLFNPIILLSSPAILLPMAD
jgi:nicotinamide-nucleotide amidase